MGSLEKETGWVEMPAPIEPEDYKFDCKKFMEKLITHFILYSLFTLGVGGLALGYMQNYNKTKEDCLTELTSDYCLPTFMKVGMFILARPGIEFAGIIYKKRN